MRKQHRKFTDSDSESESDFETEALQSSKPGVIAGASDESDCNLNDSKDEISSGDEHMSRNLVSDDDSSPEDVSFTASKMSALKKMKEAMKQISSEKEKKKVKRKQVQEKYTQQKKKKNNLEDCKLPDDFFENISDEFLTRKSEAVEKPEIISPDPIESDDSLSSEEGPVYDEEENYVPLTMNKIAGVNVRVIKEEEKNANSLSESALDIKHKLLYGGRIRREPTKARLGKIQKKKANRR